MELKKYLTLLYNNRFSLIVIPIITVIITFFLVRNLADVYSAQAQIATGIVDDTQVTDVFGIGVVKEANATQEFSNLIEMMRLKRMVDQVSYKLIIHDLTSPEPFRPLSAGLQGLNAQQKATLVAQFRKKNEQQQSLSLLNPVEKKLDDMLHSMRYHESDLKGSLNVFRAGISDFIFVQFDSEQPELSAFVANTLATDFSAYYTTLLKENQTKSVIYLDRLLKEKFKAMNDKILALNQYKIDNGILDVGEQSSSIYAQMMSFEAKRKDVEKDVMSLSGAINGINKKFDPSDRRYLESSLIKPNQEVMRTKERIKILLDQQMANDFDEWYQPRIDSLQRVLTAQVNAINDKYVTNPLNTAQGLVNQKIDLEVQLDLARYSQKSLTDAVDKLNSQFKALVPNEAIVQSFERDIELASKEYQDILNKYNQIHMESGFSGKLRVIQEAMPGTPQPSKKMLLVIISGIISFFFCLVVLFVMYYLDNSIKFARDLANKTRMPVIGEISKTNLSNLSISQLWDAKELDPEQQLFKDQLRSLRLEVSKIIDLKQEKCKILALTSFTAGEGKTISTLGLAYAFANTNQKVLVIDGNVHNPTLTKFMNHPNFLEDYLLTGVLGKDINTSSNVFGLGNKGKDTSLEELSDFKNIQERFDTLKEHLDLIVVEIPTLDNIDKSREWITYSDYVLSIFEVNKTITEDKKKQLQYLKSLDDKFIGWVLNRTDSPIAKTKSS